jgi:hypothetical protein
VEHLDPVPLLLQEEEAEQMQLVEMYLLCVLDLVVMEVPEKMLLQVLPTYVVVYLLVEFMQVVAVDKVGLMVVVELVVGVTLVVHPQQTEVEQLTPEEEVVEKVDLVL